MQSLQGDNKWAEWLGKHGYGVKTDITTNGESINVAMVQFVDADKKDTNTDTE